MSTSRFVIGSVDFRPTTWQLSDGKGGFLVRIRLRDGTIEYGPNYSPAAAARVFWQAVARTAPEAKA